MADKGKGKAAGAPARPAHVPGAQILQCFVDADGQHGTPKISYDVDKFQAAVMEIVLPDVNARPPPPKEEVASEEQAVTINKEDLQALVSELDLTAKDAEKLLRRDKGNLVDALRLGTAPTVGVS